MIRRLKSLLACMAMPATAWFGLTGKRALYRDTGRALVVRSDNPLGPVAQEVKAPSDGQVTAFTLKAVACRKVKGQRRWFAKGRSAGA